MTTEAKVEEKSEKQEAAQPPAQQEKAITKEAAPAKGQQSLLAEDKGSAKAVPPTRQLIDDDDELPDNETFQLTKKAFNARMDRATKAQLREVANDLGVDVASAREAGAIREAIKARFAKLKALEDQDEERRRKEMTELEKHKEDLARERSRANASEQRWLQEQEARGIEQTDSKIERIAREFIDSDDYDYVSHKLARWLVSEGFIESDKFPEKHIRGWLSEFAEKNPKFAKGATDQPAKTVPLTNGASPRKPDAQQASGSSQETPLGKRSKQEILQAGYRW